MTLAQGRTYLAIPGPSVVPDQVLNAMHATSTNIYEGALVEMMPALVADLKGLARTTGDVAIYIGNGHALWEASLANIVAPGDKVLVLVGGAFGQGWADTARTLGADIQVLEFANNAPIDVQAVEQALRADTAGEIRAVLAVHVDTSGAVRSDIAALGAMMAGLDHPALLMVDCIASLGCDRFEMDAWGVDVMIAASQKGLMMPPGLGLVFVSAKAKSAQKRLVNISPYWDWAPRIAPELFYQYFAGTAPVQHLLGLRAALDLIQDEGGVQAVWARHEKLANAIWAACDKWAENGALRLHVADPVHRSHSVTALYLQAPLATALREWCETKTGVTLGIGLGMAPPDDPEWHGYFRIGHMGHVNAHMVLGVLGVIDAGLKALDVKHGNGALAAASQVISTA